jgi:hypothetical protein
VRPEPSNIKARKNMLSEQNLPLFNESEWRTLQEQPKVKKENTQAKEQKTGPGTAETTTYQNNHL